VVGNNDGTVNNCVALNANIVATGINFGRVASNGTVTTSYARSDMRKDGIINSWAQGNNTKNGESITLTEWNNPNWWSDTAQFDFTSTTSAWYWPTDKSLPILQGIPENVQNPKVID
jgi:hypothetical protein